MWYEVGCSNKILAWREWRLMLDSLTWDECKDEVAKQWNLVPRVNHYLVIDDIDNWPTPWELINDDIYCDLSVALGMFYTFVLTSHLSGADARLKILKIKDNWVNLCLVDGGKYVLNWDAGKVVNIPIPQLVGSVFDYSIFDFTDKLDIERDECE